MCKAMCPCCNKTCGKIALLIFGGLTLVMGAIIFGLSFFLRNSDLFSNTGSDSIERVGDGVFYAMLIFGGIGFLIGVLGILTALIKHYCCIACYAIWAFIIALIYLIIGAVMIYIGVQGGDALDSFCTSSSSSGGINDFISDIDN